MNCNFDSDEYFYSHQNFDTEDYNGKKSLREILYFSKKLKSTGV